MRIHKIIEQTAAEGPGIRFCIWMQGCSRRCIGCFNPETWSHEGGEEVSPEELIDRILSTPDIEGISLLGGEPMEQAKELHIVAAAVRRAGLSVLCFSGYTLAEIRALGNEDMLSLLSETDLLIDGPFIQAEKDLSRPWLGSRNQNYCFLSDRYSMADVDRSCNRMEIRILPNGEIMLNGMADEMVLETLGRLRDLNKGEHKHAEKG